MIRVRLPAGIVVRIRGTRNDPINAIPKIMTGKRAKERLPNIVEWIRHSSFTMFLKSSNMAILPDKREEERGQVFVPCSQFGNGAGVEQRSLVDNRKPRADLLSNLEDVGRDEDRLTFPGISCEE